MKLIVTLEDVLETELLDLKVSIMAGKKEEKKREEERRRINQDEEMGSGVGSAAARWGRKESLRECWTAW